MVPAQCVQARRGGFSAQREVRPSRRTSALKERKKQRGRRKERKKTHLAAITALQKKCQHQNGSSRPRTQSCSAPVQHAARDIPNPNLFAASFGALNIFALHAEMTVIELRQRHKAATSPVDPLRSPPRGHLASTPGTSQVVESRDPRGAAADLV